ncbi:MAG: hypothetical protein IJ877_00940 [Candidatus Gastranaerophilales bacterium]|nr:hypothetical protein [Candidatus Gastranaerophilales bacterium]
MTNNQSKMQIRAQVMQMLSKYRDIKNPSNIDISQDIDILEHIKDKEYVARLLFKEIGTGEMGDFTNICAIMALEAIDNDSFEKSAINFLRDKSYSDEKKFLMISLIKQKGIYFDYDEIENYIASPEQVAQKGVKGFLLNSINDPEVQIDLLDFFGNIPKEERLYLLNNISQEDMPDSIAHTMSLLCQLEVENEELSIIEDTLLKSSSPYAIEGLEHIIENYNINLKLRQKLKKELAKLKEDNPDFINNSIIKDSVINDSYISFIDGNSNFSLILSRKMKDSSIDAVLLSINTKQGILACMGFGNITPSNYTTIIRRLFPDSSPIKISPQAFKALFLHYKNKNKKTDTPLPYELLVWEKLLGDIQDINYDISEFINSKLDTLNLTEGKVKKFVTSAILDPWYWPYGQNKYIDEIIDTIEKEHITEYDKIDEIVSKSIDEHFINDKEFLTEIKDRLLLLAYIAQLARLKISSAVSYSLCFKNDYFKMFITSLIDRSIYEYFINSYSESIHKKERNIFKRGKKTSFNTKELDSLMDRIEAKWR